MWFRSLLFAVTWLPAFTVIAADRSIAMKPGGWSEASVTDEAVVAAAAFAVQAKQAVMREEGDEAKLTLAEVESAEQQVVQGMNYRLTLRVLHDGQARTAQAVVWARVWLDEAERYRLTAWQFTETTTEADRSLR